MTTTAIRPETPNDWCLFADFDADPSGQTYGMLARKAAHALTTGLASCLSAKSDESLKLAWERLEIVMREYRSVGAEDSEPRTVAALAVAEKVGRERLARVLGIQVY